MVLLKPTDIWIRSPQVVLHEEFNDCAVLYHPLFDDTIGTSPVGVIIWKAFNGQRSLAEIAAFIKAECEDVPATVQDDTLTFSQELYRRFFILKAPEGDQK